MPSIQVDDVDIAINDNEVVAELEHVMSEWCAALTEVMQREAEKHPIGSGPLAGSIPFHRPVICSSSWSSALSTLPCCTKVANAGQSFADLASGNKQQAHHHGLHCAVMFSCVCTHTAASVSNSSLACSSLVHWLQKLSFGEFVMLLSAVCMSS